MAYSQNSEDLFALNYFGSYKGALLEIGANDGATLSNSKLLIENGWEAYLLEPGCVCGDLMMLHRGNPHVHIYNYGIGERDEMVSFWESGPHVLNGKDKGLVSTANFHETLRWPDVEFIEREIQLVSFDNFYNYADRPKFDFISIDAEGYDWKILQQMDLDALGCRCLCIEWNSDPKLLQLFTDYCKGFKIGLQNAENLIFVR